MATEKRKIGETTDRAELAKQMVEEYAVGLPINHRERLRLCLLIEEALGMIYGIIDQADGEIWIDGWGAETRIRIDVSAKPNAEQQEALNAIAGNGAAGSGRSFMRTLGGLILDSMHHVKGRVKGVLGRGIIEDGAEESEWSLKAYRDHLDGGDEDSRQALEDLERSIVAHIADDVILRMRGGQVSLLIIRHHL